MFAAADISGCFSFGGYMRKTVALLLLFLFCCLVGSGQDREKMISRIKELNEQIRIIESEILQPDVADHKAARLEGLEAVRLMPREKYDHVLTLQGGGSYYSFTNRSHDYQKTAQVGLEQNNLRVGFAGADYGFIADLGAISLDSVTTEVREIGILANYKPPTRINAIRNEQRKSDRYATEGATYFRYVPAITGHVYALRAISFERADILVAFKIHRKDTDGSIVIFWKPLAVFDTPLIEREPDAALIAQ